MGLRRRFSVLVAVVIGAAGPVPLSAAADEPVPDLYVDTANCSDAGAGTQAAPFCTVQRAADVVEPGQTVHVLHADHQGTTVTLARSGTADAPISFVGVPAARADKDTSELFVNAAGEPALVLSGVHHVRISDLSVRSAQGDGIDVRGSSDVSFDTVAVTGVSDGESAAFSVDGSSSDVSLTRDMTAPYPPTGVTFTGGTGGGPTVVLAAGAQNVTMASSVFAATRAGGVYADGVRGLTLTGNTFGGVPCAAGLTLGGGTSGTIENNVLQSAAPIGDPACAAAPLVSVAADTTGTVNLDYNAFSATALRFAYSWGGTDYPTAADLASAVPGQAQHDVDFTGVANSAPADDSPLTDSGDAHAPGITARDFLGEPRSTNDPNTPDTGSGAVDRGAYEAQSALDPGATYSRASGLAPVDFTVSAAPTDSWGEAVSTTVDFGEGAGPEPAVDGTASHVFTATGVHTVTTTATNSDGQTASTTTTVKVATPTAPKVTLTESAVPNDVSDVYPDTAAIAIDTGGDNWEIPDARLGFGNGIDQDVVDRSGWQYSYTKSGVYTATYTGLDIAGRHLSASVTFAVGDLVLPLSPQRVYDTRTSGHHKIAAHSTLTLPWTQLGAGGHPSPRGIYLNATVTGATASGYLTVYPDSTPRPASSTLNFGAGTTVANSLLAHTGQEWAVEFYNGSSESIDLVLDRVGLEVAPNADSGPQGGTYTPVGPTRLLDTRNATGARQGAVAGKSELTFTAAGVQGVPADATAVVLNVAATDTKANGYLGVYGHGTAFPGNSDANWSAGQTVSDLALVSLTDGKAVVHNGSSGSADFVADVVGYYQDRGHASVEVSTPQTRVLDTRDGTGRQGFAGKVGARATVKLKVTDVNGVLPTGVTAAELNLTVQHQTKNGYITAYPDGTTRPTAASVNFRSGMTVANAAVLPVGKDGEIDFYNGSDAPVDLIVDQSGFYYTHPA